MANKKRQQTINKRNRERAVAEKRALKQQARQEKREALRNGEEWPPVERSPFDPLTGEQPAGGEPAGEQPAGEQPAADEQPADEPSPAEPG
jgi:hypothetical protein